MSQPSAPATSWRALLAVRDVRVVVPAAALSMAGDAMALVALLLRVHDSGAGPYAVMALLMCFSLPAVLTMGLAGAVADTHDARLVIAVAGVAQVGAGLGLALVHGTVATCLLVLVLQTGFAFSSPVWSALVPRIAGEELVGRMVSLQQGLRAVAAPAGAGLGGVLVQTGGDSVVFLLDAVTSAALVAGGLGLRTSRPGTGSRGRPPWLPTEGLAVLRADGVAGPLLLAMLPFVVTLEALTVVEVFLVRDVLHATPAQYGLAEVALGVGAVVGALLAGPVAGNRGRVVLVLAGMAVMAAGQVLQGVAPVLAVFLLAALVVGVANAASNAAVFALVITRLPDAGRGKVVALANGVGRAANVLALVVGGVAGSTLGPRPAFVVCGVLGLLVTAVAAARLRSRLPAADAPARDDGAPPLAA